MAKVLCWFGEKLHSDWFIRTHRSHLVNRKFICRYIHGNGGQVCLQNGDRIDVVKRKKVSFLKCAAA